MKKILLPVDGTEASLRAAKYVSENYDPENCAVTAVIVSEDFFNSFSDIDEQKKAESEAVKALDIVDPFLLGFSVKKEVITAKSAGERLVGYAFDNKFDTIVLTKATKKGIMKVLGSVSQYVARYAESVVVIVP